MDETLVAAVMGAGYWFESAFSNFLRCFTLDVSTIFLLAIFL